MQSLSSPLISVLLPVYNCSTYVGSAIESILSQTFEHFELIVIDDGSTDDTYAVLAGFRDPRIRLFRQENQGLAATLNRAISLAQAPILARQDQDDLSMPDRLAKQYAYMQSHPDCGLLGTWAQIMEVDKLSDRFHRHPADSSELRYHLLFNNPFVHSSVVLRASVLDQVGGYSVDPERQPPEDYELWSRISRVADVANLPEVLLIYRELPASMSRTGRSPFQTKLILLCAENLSFAAKISWEDPALKAIASLTHGSIQSLDVPPDFQRMRLILSQAIETIATDDTRNQLQRDAEARIQNLQASWMAYRLPFTAVLQRQGPLRSAAKKALSVWSRVWNRR